MARRPCLLEVELVIAWLRLIRWKNLLIIFGTQLFAWFCIVKPMKSLTGVSFFLDGNHFLLLSLSTVLIAAGGYIINDYFDVKIDNINHPEKMVLNKVIPRKHAIIVHSILNIVAFVIGAILAWYAGHLSFVLLQVFCTAMLWFYSTKFKQRFAIGNLVVAFLTALIIILLILYEPSLYAYFRRGVFICFKNELVLPNPVWVLVGYAFFAFIFTWIREAVKDMEDFKGDEAEGCVTMPIIWGLKKTVFFTNFLAIIALIPLLFFTGKLLMNNNFLLSIYLFLAVILPILFFIKILPNKSTSTHYSFASRLLKWIMVTGVCSLIIYYYEAHV